MNIKETDDLWRLYRREWVTVHTIDSEADDGREAFDAARAWIAENLTGRVQDQHIQIELNTDLSRTFWAHIKVFKDNLKGEFKYADSAQMFAMKKQYDEYTVVPRNSKTDHEIRSYGVVKL